MIIRGQCARSDAYNTIINAIATSGLWTQVSSNPTEDFNGTAAGWAGSDGNIFKSTYSKNGQHVFFAIKQAHNWATAVTAGMNIRVNMLGNYIPGSAGVNGTWENYYTTGGYAWALTNLGTSLATVLEYVITIEAHRIIIVLHQAGVTTTPSNILYVGFSDLDESVDGASYINAYLIPNIVAPTVANAITTGGYLYPIMLKSPVQWAERITSTYVAPILDSISNPNYENIYSVATIDVRYTYSSAYLGFIACLDGIYGLPATNIVHLDKLLIEGTEHLVVKSYVPSTVNAFGCMWMAIRLT